MEINPQDRESLFNRMVALRRRLHQYPEPSFREIRTAEIIAAELERLGIEFRSGVGGTGIVAEIRKGGGATVAIRADMDGLPIEEETGLDFASRNPGMMHACGHDGHMAMAVGAAAILKDAEVGGSFRFIFQPAEEGGGGAGVMVKQGALEGVDVIIGGHIDITGECGEISAADGLICAWADEFSIEISGNGGHAARPHEAPDPVVAAAALVTGLQSLVSRGADPLRPCVISIGEIKAGTAPNVIAGRAVIRGTIRSTDSETRKKLINGVKRVADATAVMFEVKTETVMKQGYPPVVNDPRIIRTVRKVIERRPEDYRLRQPGPPSLGGEDFSFYLERRPGCFLRIGARPPVAEPAPPHSPGFDFDEKALMPGALLFARAAAELAETEGGTRQAAAGDRR